MRNLLLISLELLICYISIILLNKKYKLDGMYVYGIIATFTSCIMSLKQIDLFNITVPIGFGVTTSLIIAGNIITQKKGPDALKTYITLILITGLISCCFINMSGVIESSEYNKYANLSYDNIFKYNLRIYIADIISILTGVFLGSRIYYALKKIYNKIIISNTFTIIITELTECLIFMLIGFMFTYDTITIILSIVLRYLIKVIIGIIGTIPIYITNKYN